MHPLKRMFGCTGSLVWKTSGICIRVDMLEHGVSERTRNTHTHTHTHRHTHTNVKFIYCD